MAFPIFALPFEIRTIICAYCIAMPPAMSPNQNVRGIHRSLTSSNKIHKTALMRTCQQMYEECAHLLYGVPTYHLRDKEYENRCTVRFLCPYCPDCFQDRTTGAKPVYYRLEHSWTKCRRHASHKNSHVNLPSCDFTGIDDWFEIIGRRGQILIRSLHLHFTRPQFMYRDRDIKGVRRSFPLRNESYYSAGGDSVAEFLKILAQAGGLKSLRISLGWVKYVQELSADEERHWVEAIVGEDRGLGPALRSFSGIETFELDIGGQKWPPISNQGVHEEPHDGLLEEFEGLILSTPEELYVEFEALKDRIMRPKILREGPDLRFPCAWTLEYMDQTKRQSDS